MEPEATSSITNIPSTWYGKWDGRYENCTKTVKKSIQQQIHHGVWSRGHFPGVNITGGQIGLGLRAVPRPGYWNFSRPQSTIGPPSH